MLQRMATTVGDGEEPVSILDLEILRHDSHYHLSEAQSPFGPLWIPAVHDESGATRRIQIAARDVSLGLHYDHESSILNQLSAEVASVTETGPAQVLVRLLPVGDPRGASLLALITRRSRDTLGIKPGARVFVRVKGVQLME
jgi:molybdate transport system ATP-binding protein